MWLRSQPDQTAEWTGIRNLEARNMLRNSVQLGDKCIFYMGSCSTPAALAVVSIVKAAYPVCLRALYPILLHNPSLLSRDGVLLMS